MDRFKIFVSRSFNRSEGQLVEPVLEFCRAIGFDPVDTGRASSSAPVEKVREAMRTSRAFLGILTREDGSSRTHDWVTTEIGMAEYARIPIVLFIEDGVDYRPADHITSWGTFSRSEPQKLWQDVVRSLTELREHPTIRSGVARTTEADYYRFLVDDVVVEIQPDGRSRHIRYIELESNVRELRKLFPIQRIITSSRLLGYFDSLLEFRVVQAIGRVTCKPEIGSPRDVSYEVMFDPPLEKGERASFTMTHESRGSLPLLMEDIESLKRFDYVDHKNVSRQGHAIRVPTERFALRVEFPNGYPIRDCSPRADVTLRNGAGTSQLSGDEVERIRSSFRVRHNRLELEVEQPKLDHAYYFEWRPPLARSLTDDLDLGLDLPESP